MTDFLVEHALRNVWCSPGQDNQLIFAPKRISRHGGAFGYTKIVFRSIPLPLRSKYYHVYQIGQISPKLIGLFDPDRTWAPERWYMFSDAINRRSVEITVYNADGVCFPRYKAHFMFTRERALIFAFESDPLIPINFDEDQIFVRLYTNAYYQTGMGRDLDLQMQTVGFEPGSISSIMYLQTQIAALRQRPGIVKCWKNGILVNDFTLANCGIGDRLEWVYDSSVKRVVTFPIKDLPSFHSTLDKAQKYLLHYTKGLDERTIDYQDDIDLFVQTPAGLGLYVNRNQPSHHRMLTHRDYSVQTDAVTQVSSKLNQLYQVTDDLILTMHIREGGYRRELIKDHQRIFELYKLSDKSIVEAMIGVDSTVSYWTCDGLESSGYTLLMRSAADDVDVSMVESAYGYNTICKLVGDTPTALGPVGSFELLPAQVSDSTIYEYDANGLMLGVHRHEYGLMYYKVNPNAQLVEVIPSSGSDTPNVVFGSDLLNFDTACDYRVYRSRKFYGIPNGVWEDITAFEGEYFLIKDGTLFWIDPSDDQFLMVRTDKKFLSRDVSLLGNQGMLNFSLMEMVDKGDGLKDHYCSVPAGQYDIFINGNSAVEGVDFVIEFPVVHITSKRYLKHPVFDIAQDIHYRALGFCDMKLAPQAISERGWVEYGMLSNNLRYDLRDDKVQRIVLNGATVSKDSVSFKEDNPGIFVEAALNGAPYEIKDMMVPIGSFVTSDAMALRQKSLEVDKAISNYLTVKIDQSPPDGPSVIHGLYPLVSPFFAHLIYLLQNDQLLFNTQSTFPASEILAICKPFEGLLKWDPISTRNKQDPRYTYICPHFHDHVRTLKMQQYRFLQRVVYVYAKDVVDLTPFLKFDITT